MAKVVFTPNIQRHVALPEAEASGRTVRDVLEAVFADIAHSPERMRAFYSKTKHLPAKITAFIDFLKTATASD